MKPVTQELLRQAAAAFAFDRPAGEAERFGAGHINDTFAVWAADRSKRWILQRINTDTFTDPAGLMENVTGVTAYLRRQIIERGGDPDRETLNVIPTLDGKPYYTDTEGGAWRAYIFVEGTVCLQKVENERDFYTTAETFGNFQNQLAGYPAATLHETIARFHDTPNRYANFEKALAADVMGRAKEVGPEIAFIRAREADCRVLVDQLNVFAALEGTEAAAEAPSRAPLWACEPARAAASPPSLTPCCFCWSCWSGPPWSLASRSRRWPAC